MTTHEETEKVAYTKALDLVDEVARRQFSGSRFIRVLGEHYQEMKQRAEAAEARLRELRMQHCANPYECCIHDDPREELA